MVNQREDLSGRVNATHDVVAKRYHLVRKATWERRGNENPALQVLAHASQACGLVGRRADDRELHALCNPKVPVHHVANM